MALVRGGYTVLPHVQAFCDEVEARELATSFGTYAGHDPVPEQAVDVFVSVDDATQGNQICEFAIAHMFQYGIRYIIFRQRIYNPEIADYWRPMEDRGSITANHYDHVHLTFYEVSAYVPPEEDWLSALTDQEQRNLYAWVKDLQSYMSEEKGGAVDTLLEAVAGVVNETKYLASTSTTQLITFFARFDPEYPARKDIDIGRERLATILLKLDESGG